MMRTLAACLAALVAAAAAEATTLYVDDLGDGSAGTGTEADPFRDLQLAIEIVKK